MASVFGNTGVIVLADLTCEPFKIPVQTNSTNLITSFMKKMTTGEAQEDPGGFQWWLLDSALTGQTGSHHLYHQPCAEIPVTLVSGPMSRFRFLVLNMKSVSPQTDLISEASPLYSVPVAKTVHPTCCRQQQCMTNRCIQHCNKKAY